VSRPKGLIRPRDAFAALGLGYTHYMRKVDGLPRWMSKPNLLACAVPHPTEEGAYLFRADLIEKIRRGERVAVPS
jgi:hypothetical protein